MLTLPALDGVTRAGMNYYDCGDLYQSFLPGTSTIARYEFTLTPAAAPVVPAVGQVTVELGNCCKGIHVMAVEIPDPMPSNLNTWFMDLLNTNPIFVSVGRATIENGKVVWTSFVGGLQSDIRVSFPNTVMSVVTTEVSAGEVQGYSFEPFTVGVVNRAVDWNSLVAPTGLASEHIAGIVVSCLTFQQKSPGSCDCDCGGCSCISVKKRGKVYLPLESTVVPGANLKLYYRIARNGSLATQGALSLAESQPVGTLPYPEERYEILNITSDLNFATILLR